MTLIKVMRPSEKRLLRYYLARVTNAEHRQRQNLFNLIDQDGVTDSARVKEALGAKMSTSAFSHLKSRLRSDILNVLLQQESGKRLAQPNRAAEFECRKKVAQLHLLLLRGAQAEGMKLIGEVARLAERFELFAERMQANHLLMEIMMGRQRGSDLAKIATDIDQDAVRFKALVFAESQSLLFSDSEFSKNLKVDKSKYEKTLGELKSLYESHGSARLGFWYHVAYNEYYNAVGDHQAVAENSLQLLKLVEEKPAVRSKNNIAGVNLTLGTAYQESREFLSAVTHLNNAQKLFPVSGFNRLQSLEFLAQAHIASEAYDDALDVVRTAMEHPRILAREEIRPKWLYIKACVEFLKGDVRDSFKTLNSDSYIMRQRDEWNMQFRILDMLQLVHFKDEVWLDFRLKATRRFLSRNNQLATPRVKVAMALLADLLRKGLDADRLSERTQKLLNDSLQEKEDYEWQPSGPEMVRADRYVERMRQSGRKD